jgi:SAM-dependent methyltransferase
MSDAPRHDRSFDRIARAYELLVDEEKRWANEREALAQWLSDAGQGERRVLDLGCGTGFHARHLSAHLDAKVVGADPAQAMLEVARGKEHGKLIQWIAATAEAPPPGPFDLILLLGNTLSLVAKPQAVLEACAGIAVIGSLFIIQTLDYDALRERGPQHVKRSGDDLSIEKTLTPHPTGSPTAAALSLTIRDGQGEMLDELTDELLDHPTEALIAEAASCGWSVLEERRSYRDPASGDDRILVFRRS